MKRGTWKRIARIGNAYLDREGHPVRERQKAHNFTDLQELLHLCRTKGVGAVELLVLPSPGRAGFRAKQGAHWVPFC